MIDGANAGLDLFAAGWLEYWTAKGGSVDVEPDGRAAFVIPEYWNSVECSSSIAATDCHHEYRAAKYDGEMRGALDLLKLVPGGMDALKAHVARYPSHTYIGGTMRVAGARRVS